MGNGSYDQKVSPSTSVQIVLDRAATRPHLAASELGMKSDLGRTEDRCCGADQQSEPQGGV